MSKLIQELEQAELNLQAACDYAELYPDDPYVDEAIEKLEAECHRLKDQIEMEGYYHE